MDVSWVLCPHTPAQGTVSPWKPIMYKMPFSKSLFEEKRSYDKPEFVGLTLPIYHIKP